MKLEALTLSQGSHMDRNAGVCTMEAVAWLAGEPHTDAPKCACPVVARLVININDRMGDNATRDKHLKPLLPKLIGSRSTARVEIKRAFVAVDWYTRVHVPFVLDVRGYKAEAQKLRDLAEIKDVKTVEAARTVAWELHSALDLDLARALDLDLARALALALALARALDRALDLDLDLARALALARALDRALDLDQYWANQARMIEAMLAVTE